MILPSPFTRILFLLTHPLLMYWISSLKTKTSAADINWKYPRYGNKYGCMIAIFITMLTSLLLKNLRARFFLLFLEDSSAVSQTMQTLSQGQLSDFGMHASNRTKHKYSHIQ